MQRSAALHCELGECLVKLNTLPEAEEQFRLALGCVCVCVTYNKSSFFLHVHGSIALTPYIFHVRRCEPESERAQKNLLAISKYLAGQSTVSNFSDGEYVRKLI